MGAALIVALAAVAAYANSLGHALVWDDLGLLAYLDSLSGLAEVLSSEFRLDAPYGYYRPVILASLAADRAFGAGALPFHLQNVLLHAACSVLVLRLARHWLPGKSAAFLAALVFAWHPAHVESVAFVSGRTDLWAALFLLASTCIWSRDRLRPAGFATRIAGGAAFLLALLSKEVALMLPAVLALWACLAPAETSTSLRRSQGPWLVTWALALALWALARWAAGVGLGAGDAIDRIAPLRESPGLIPAVWLAYDRLLVWPWPLSAFYTQENLSLLWPAACSALLTLACVITFGRRHGRLGWLAGIWIVGFLVPVSGVVPLRGAIVAERFLYVPSIGYALLLGYLAGRAWCWTGSALRRHALRGLIAVALAALLVGTVQRTRVWRDEVALFESVIETSPQAVLAYNNLAAVHGREGRLSEAVTLLRQAVQMRPDYVEAWTNLGFAHLKLKQPEEAIAAYRQALRYDPDYARARFDLALVLHRRGDTQGAQRHYQALRSLDPASARRLAGLMRAVPTPGRDQK